MKHHQKDRSNEQIRHKGGIRNHMQAKPSFEDIHCVHGLSYTSFSPSALQLVLYDLISHPHPFSTSATSNDIHPILEILMGNDEFG
jgi:hypothetical protein